MSTKNSDFITFLLVGFCSLSIAFFFPLFSSSDLSRSIDDLTSWYVYLLSHELPSHYKIVGVVVDQHSLYKMDQRWPWKRSVYAELIRKLGDEKVRALGIDLVFVGDSEDPEDDRLFAEALKESTARVVLSYFVNFSRGLMVMPLDQFRASAYAVGLLNTPNDTDNKIRRARAFIQLNGSFYYSFPVVLASAYLNQSPETVVSRLPLQSDMTFRLNYHIRPRDIIRVSFVDALNNMEGLKKQYGQDFLKDALVLVYSETDIPPDTYNTPIGVMPGGMLHINAAANIFSRTPLRNAPAVATLLALFTFLAVFYLLRRCDFLSGAVFCTGVLVFDFWGCVFLRMGGVAVEFSPVFVFVFFFFAAGSLYKYTSFLAAMLRIKEKATIDPLRNVYTPRYFYYRIGLETQKFLFRKDYFLILVRIDDLKSVSESTPWDRLRELWLSISSILSAKSPWWAMYSSNEIMGCIISPRDDIERTVRSLRKNLIGVLHQSDSYSPPKIAYVRLKKGYPLGEMVSALSTDLQQTTQEIMQINDYDMRSMLEFTPVKERGYDNERLLDTFDEDIEDKNRQLLNLIENLTIEHARIKSAFFQIITSLVKALEARDPYTEGHSERVSSYALMLADKLGWRREEKDDLHKAALLHDLGKIGIPDQILHKKGGLTSEEYDLIKKHEIIAVKILEPLKDMSKILPWILYHHERWDGKGYPHGLGGEAIPEASQIIAIADVFDTLTTGRDYKVSYSVRDALQEIQRNKGTQFSPRLVDLLIGIMEPPIRF